MKSLYLLRHAKSDWDAVYDTDHDRPLSKRGRQNAEELKEFLEKRKLSFPLCLVSTSRRTRQTLEILEESKKLKFYKILKDPQIYEANYTALINHLQEISEDYAEILLIAHNPGLEELANGLLQTRSLFQKFPTSAFLSLHLDIHSWRELKNCEARLGFYWIPSRKKDET